VVRWLTRIPGYSRDVWFSSALCIFFALWISLCYCCYALGWITQSLCYSSRTRFAFFSCYFPLRWLTHREHALLTYCGSFYGNAVFAIADSLQFDAMIRLEWFAFRQCYYCSWWPTLEVCYLGDNVVRFFFLLCSYTLARFTLFAYNRP